jgi:DNA-binding CsgD family transcriptional regulator
MSGASYPTAVYVGGTDELDKFTSDQASPEEEYAAKQMFAAMAAAMDPRELRILEALRDGDTAGEIAEREGLSVGYVKNLIVEVRAKAREAMR